MRITAKQACANYAANHLAVKEWTAIMKANSCTQVEKNMAEFGAGIKNNSECINLHWMLENHQYPPYERPALEEEKMCPGCRATMAAYFSRKIARARLGASKRTLLAIGKRLNSGGVL